MGGRRSTRLRRPPAPCPSNLGISSTSASNSRRATALLASRYARSLLQHVRPRRIVRLAGGLCVALRGPREGRFVGRSSRAQTTERSRCDRPVERPVTHQRPEREEPGTAITSEAARVDERIERRKQAAGVERMIRQARRRRQRRRRAQLAAAALQQLIQPAVKQPACEQVRRFNR
jgi:hypothetical protein